MPQRDCRSNFKWPSMQREQCPIYNSTLETLIWSSMNYILGVLIFRATFGTEMMNTPTIYQWFCCLKLFIFIYLCFRRVHIRCVFKLQNLLLFSWKFKCALCWVAHTWINSWLQAGSETNTHNYLAERPFKIKSNALNWTYLAAMIMSAKSPSNLLWEAASWKSSTS